MKQTILVLFVFIALTSCGDTSHNLGNKVSNIDELNNAIRNAEAGDKIVMANGDWKDVQIKFFGNGTETKPISLRAETPGEVIIKGQSNLSLGGTYLKVEGLHFTNGYSPTRSVISFALNKDTLAHHSTVSNCVITDFNKPRRNQSDLWVNMKGRHNQLDHCYIAGKANRGPTVRVDLEGNESIKNYHKIINNHFGPRPPKGGPSAETIQIGNSYTSMAPSYTMVANNLFERCNGEVEVISSKTNFNEFRNNVFYKSEGSLVTRHGNYCTIDGNYFIGDNESDHIGGIRLIGTGHWVTNNYFYNLNGKIFRSPLAVMNGIPKSPLNRYIQVTDVVVAYNSWINCINPLQFGVGSNIAEKDVLPASEIRSERPIRTIVANNLIHNTVGDKEPIVAHDQLDGIEFKSNLINNQNVSFEPTEGFEVKDFALNEIEEAIWVPSSEMPDVAIHNGFEFEKMTKDLFGNSRKDKAVVGAISHTSGAKPDIMNWEKYGPTWELKIAHPTESKNHSASNSSELVEVLQQANGADVITLKPGVYEIKKSLKINKPITIRSADDNNKAHIKYMGAAASPAFEMNPKGNLTLSNIKLQGSKIQYAFSSLKNDMSSPYSLKIDNCEVSDFDYLLQAYKYSMCVDLVLQSSSFKNCNNGFDLSAETDDKGDYNAENFIIDNCQFENIDRKLVDYYRGGYDESTVGGNLIVRNSQFTKCGAKDKTGTLLNTYGILNVNIADNTFRNNQIQRVAQLWGAKNNTHSNNKVSSSGKIVVEENLKLKLMY